MSILYAISIVYIAAEYDGPPFCTPIGMAVIPDIIFTVPASRQFSVQIF